MTTNNGYGAIDLDDLAQVAKATGLAFLGNSAESKKNQIGKGLTPQEITNQRDVIEFLVCELSSLHMAWVAGRDPDDILALHNAIIWRIWQELDVLAMWAGGERINGLHGHYAEEQCGSEADCIRAEFAKTCNRLYAEVEAGAHIAEVEITVHNDDGTEVSYSTGVTSIFDYSARPPICRTIHEPDHQGCIDATVIDLGEPDEP